MDTSDIIGAQPRRKLAKRMSNNIRGEFVDNRLMEVAGSKKRVDKQGGVSDALFGSYNNLFNKRDLGLNTHDINGLKKNSFGAPMKLDDRFTKMIAG